MATKNDITGDSLISRTSEAYRNNYDAIFGKKEKNNDKRTGCVSGETDGQTRNNSLETETNRKT